MMWMRLSIALLLLLVCSTSLYAQPTRDRVLGDVEVVEYPEFAQVRVGFNFPVRYQGHFPASSGEELRIQLVPIRVGTVDRDALFQRESFTPVKPNLAGVDEVLFEGDTRSGFYLTLFFRGQANWHVVQGSDYRSLQIEVRAPFPTASGEVKGAQ